MALIGVENFDFFLNQDNNNNHYLMFQVSGIRTDTHICIHAVTKLLKITYYVRLYFVHII